MRSLSGSLGLLLALGSAFAAETPANAEGPPDDLKIALNAEQALLRHTDLFRRVTREEAEAQKEWGALDEKTRARALGQVMSYAKEDLRLQAVKALSELTGDGDPVQEALGALVNAALRDTDAKVRDAAGAEVLAQRPAGVEKAVVKHLRAKDPEGRARAVKMLEALKGPRVFEAVIEHWRETWGAGPRAHMFVAQQRAYVADYEISGDSYDPVVRTFLSGVVLDVKPLMAWADIYIVKLMREMTGEDRGADVGAWRRWWQDQQAAKAPEVPK